MIHSILIFTKAQASAFIGGVVDYFFMIFFTELFHIHYTISIALGGIMGALINFRLNKHWTFYSKDTPYNSSTMHQLLKFLPVVMISISLKSGGTYFISTATALDYKASRPIVDLIVSLFFNFPLQKYLVFKKSR